MEAFLFTLAIVWGVPILITGNLGESRRRRGWLWGLFLGWLGVLILLLMRPASPAERLADLEAKERLVDLEAKAMLAEFEPPKPLVDARHARWLRRRV